VGGTGQYVRAITEGWRIPPQAADHALRDVLEDWAKEIGRDELHRRLAVIDPEAAAQIDARNLRRVVRAIEVALLTGEKFSRQRRQTDPVYDVLQIGLHRPRKELYARVDERIERMMQNGFLAEVAELLARYPPGLPSFSAIGYPQLIAHLQGNLSMEEVVAEMKRLTRQFVRRQANWFKPDDPEIHWVPVDKKTADVLEKLALDFLAGESVQESNAVRPK
jgi:tRNA dimethylallyltransferase